MVHQRQAIEHHVRLKELFFVAVELDGEERRRFVKSACGEDHALRADLESLLRHHHHAVAADDRENGEP